MDMLFALWIFFFCRGQFSNWRILKFNLCSKISAQIGCLNILLYLFLHGFLPLFASPHPVSKPVSLLQWVCAPLAFPAVDLEKEVLSKLQVVVLIFCKVKEIYLTCADLHSKPMEYTHNLIFVCACSRENSKVTCVPGLWLLTLNARSLCFFHFL